MLVLMIMIPVLTHALAARQNTREPDDVSFQITSDSPISISGGELISSPWPSDNLTLPYPYYLHFPHEIHTFNQDMGKFSIFLFAGTPPLPALSPGQSANQTPQSSPDFRAKYKMNQAPNNLNNRPDLLENENLKKLQVGKNLSENKFDKMSCRYKVTQQDWYVTVLHCTLLYYFHKI